MKLTVIQRKAVEASGTNVLVSAGAGTGKTRILVERFLEAVISGKVLVTEILALTFTEKAANEMKARILRRLGETGLHAARQGLESAYISTIHAFAARLLKEHPVEASLDPEFRVIEEHEAGLLKEQAMDQALEIRCEKGNRFFELLRVYGEEKIRDGILKVFTAARDEGLSLAEFFARGRPAQAPCGPEEVLELFEAAGEPGLAAEWKDYALRPDWDWETVESFKAWCGQFSRKRDRKGRSEWSGIRAHARRYLACRLETFLAAWTGPFEDLALGFEEIYEALKREKGFLDFNDLEVRAVRLLSAPNAWGRKLREYYQAKFRMILVDEFQDTNGLQLRLVELLSRGRNLFLAGDYKQSIYGFRGAEPSVFLDKEKSYRDSDEGVRIPLVENFRSAPRTLEFINAFFENLWREDDFTFERLVSAGGEDASAAAVPPGAELHAVELNEGEDFDRARMREADRIAERILELHAGGTAFGDIAVLFQAMTKTALYEQALKKREIPYYAVASGGFYHQPEIRDMVSFLGFLENPRADIPLAAALRSPLFQVSDNTLFWLARAAKGDGPDEESAARPLWEGLLKLSSVSEIPDEEKEKIKGFRSLASEFLGLKDRLKISELLDLLLERTGCEMTVLADERGVRRYANLKKMVNLAREMEQYEALTLGAFLRLIRRFESEEVRESEAQVEAEASGRVVRLLTIHRAKGLEFPVVFVADLGREKRSRQSKTVVTGSGLGYSLLLRNPKTLETEKPASWLCLDEANERREREEWKRLFYVAATRAGRRLILTGVHAPAAREKESFHEMKSWMDWVMASRDVCADWLEVRTSGDPKPRRLKKSWARTQAIGRLFEDFKPRPLQSLIKDPAARQRALEEARTLLKNIEPRAFLPSRSMDLPVSAYASFQKSREDYLRIYEIGYPDSRDFEERAEDGDEDGEEPAPMAARDFGTGIHRVLERLDFENPKPGLRTLIRESFSLSAETVWAEAEGILTAFMRAPLFSKLAKAKRLLRELPFVLNERHGLIHGVIDLLYQQPDGTWHLLDYKTAEGSAEKLKDPGYETQMTAYAYAVYRLLGVPVRSGTVYFLKNQWAAEWRYDESGLEAAGHALRVRQEEILRTSLDFRG